MKGSSCFYIQMEQTLQVDQLIYQHSQPITLESGVVLPSFHLQYTTYGKLNENKDNVVWVFHALTASSEAADWWPGLVGEGKIFDPENHFIICVNMPGSHYGSTCPLDTNPDKGEPYYHDFPLFTLRDMVQTYQELRAHLGIDKIWLGIGGSMGGMQLLEWAIMEPERFENIIPIGTNAKHSPWGIALNASQRMAIESDCSWKTKSHEAGHNGMKVARSIALLSYRDYTAYNKTQQGFSPDTIDKNVDEQIFRAETYQRYQGEKLARRFNAFSYYALSRSMDSHDVGRDRGSVEQALSLVQAKTLIIGIFTDILFPPDEQLFLAKHIRDAEVHIINSMYGHDGFLLEFEAIDKLITRFLTPKF